MPDFFAALPKKIEMHAKDCDVPSLVVGISQSGEPVYEHAIGVADIDRNVATSLDTPYSVASVTKPFIGTLLAIFSDRGLIDLKRPANDYLDDSRIKAFVGREEQATVAWLANHTSGLPLHYQFFFDDEPIFPPSMDDTILRHANILYQPGSEYLYSNLGYGILGFILERVAGKPLEQIFQEEILQPPGMKNSFISPCLEDFQRAAIRYDANAEPLPPYVTDHPAASELFASVNDLLTFGSWHLGFGPAGNLTIEGRKRTWRPLSASPAAQAYALGWRLDSFGDTDVISHSGGMPGVDSRLILIPRESTVVAIVSNIASNAVQLCYEDVMRCLGLVQPTPKQVGLATYAPENVQGRWKGQIETYEGAFDIELSIGGDADSASFQGNPVACDLTYSETKVVGRIDVELPVSDAKHTPHSIILDVRVTPSTMVGAATAKTLPGGRAEMALSYPARLRR